MIPSTLKKLAGTKVAFIAAGVIVLAGAGVAGAAAVDVAPWAQDTPPVVTSPPVGEPTTTAAPEPTTTEAPTTTAAPTTSAAPAAPEPPAAPVTTAAAPVEQPMPPAPAPEPPAPAPAPAPQEEPVATTPPAPAVTEPKPDTSVPQGIELACNIVDQVAVQCEWHGGVVDGFTRYLVLRNDGRVVFGTENPDIHTYRDQPGKAGAFSYVVISVDGNNKNLSHSNPVAVQVGSAT